MPTDTVKPTEEVLPTFPITPQPWRGLTVNVQMKARRVAPGKKVKTEHDKSVAAAKAANQPEPAALKPKIIKELFPVLTPADFLNLAKVGLARLEEKRPGSAQEYIDQLLRSKAQQATEDSLKGDGKLNTDEYFDNLFSVTEPGMGSEAGINAAIAKLTGPLIEHLQAEKRPNGWKELGYESQPSFNAKYGSLVQQLAALETKLVEVQTRKAEKEAEKTAATTNAA